MNKIFLIFLSKHANILEHFYIGEKDDRKKKQTSCW